MLSGIIQHSMPIFDVHVHLIPISQHSNYQQRPTIFYLCVHRSRCIKILVFHDCETLEAFRPFMAKASHCVYSMEGELCNKAAKQEDPNVLTIATVHQLALKLCAAKMLLSIRILIETLMPCKVWDKS